jgi:hypothetical protein
MILSDDKRSSGPPTTAPLFAALENVRATSEDIANLAQVSGDPNYVMLL